MLLGAIRKAAQKIIVREETHDASGSGFGVSHREQESGLAVAERARRMHADELAAHRYDTGCHGLEGDERRSCLPESRRWNEDDVMTRKDLVSHPFVFDATEKAEFLSETCVDHLLAKLSGIGAFSGDRECKRHGSLPQIRSDGDQIEDSLRGLIDASREEQAKDLRRTP
jgi:hypothetical protein